MYRSHLSRYTLPTLCLCAALACAAALFPRAASGRQSASTVQLSAAGYNVAEGVDAVQITVTRTGIAGATVSYRTVDGTATDRSDYTTAVGTLSINENETSKTFTVLVTNDAFGEGPETFQVELFNASGTLGTPSAATVTITSDETADGPNPVRAPTFDTDFFVRQHYHDFLQRVPDAAGLAFWKNEIEQCGADAACREVKRVNVSAAFFLSIEFQETGFYALRAQRVALGRRSNDPAKRMPYRDLVRDQRFIGEGVVVGADGWEQQLALRKRFYASRMDGASGNPHITSAAYVDALYATAGVVPTAAERQEAIDAFHAANSIEGGRTSALRVVADSNSVRAAEFNDAFVLLQYHGYLRRNPTDPPDADDSGYQFWRAKLNEFNGDFIRAEMVKAFLDSDEYKRRFGP